MTDYRKISPLAGEDNYVINRAPLYRDRRDFVIQPGDTGRRDDYPTSPARNWPFAVLWDDGGLRVR